ncbi:MAG TPA: YhbY family RNA-binding protein [Desulfarculaceae bacterium]|nr:YhbY family RNA-binding protein [Desulfarculaceae bacterium]
MLKGFQKKYLKGLAHAYKPLVHIGQKGLSENLSAALEETLDSHELIKVKFIDFKEKEQKKELLKKIETDTLCELVGMTGHIAILFRQNRDPEKRRIIVPEQT